MDMDYQAAEAAAPIDQSGPLPFNVNTLQVIPEASRAKYVRKMDGSFRLAWLNEDDEESYKTYVDAIAAGDVRVVPPGKTLAEVEAENAERKAAMDAEFQTHLGELEARERAVIEARLNAEEESRVAAIRAETERRRQSYGAAQSAGFLT